MKTIKQVYEINAPVEEVWKALVDSEYINNWGGGPAKMSDEVNFKFSLWDGEIYGKNLEVLKEKKLVQDWFSKTDNFDKATKVTFNLSQKNQKTILELIHENVPDENEKDLDDGWKSFYLGPLKKYLEEK